MYPYDETKEYYTPDLQADVIEIMRRADNPPHTAVLRVYGWSAKPDLRRLSRATLAIRIIGFLNGSGSPVVEAQPKLSWWQQVRLWWAL